MAADLDDLYQLLDIMITSQDVPDNIRCALRPISAVLGSPGDRAEERAEAWLEKGGGEVCLSR